ncbi:hypothetical protein N9W41_01635, partial [bacterium]|nr:hypothetical protein [bacterium]
MSALESFIGNLSRKVVVFVALVGGVLFILISDPPHTLCNTQIKNFKEIQKGFLYLSKKPKTAKVETLYNILYTNCRDSNSPGGCYELFVQLRKMLKDSETINISALGEDDGESSSVDCRAELKSVKEFNRAI